MQTDSNKYDLGSALDTRVISTLVNRWITAFNTHNAEQIIALYAEDAELFDSGMKRPRRGRDEITTWFVQRFRQMPTIEYTPQHKVFSEREGIIQWVARGHTPAVLRQHWLMRPFEVEGVSIFRMDHGLISWQHGYYDHLHIVEEVLPPLRWLPLKL